MKIKNIKAIEILDSRGNPTVEVEVTLDNKIRAKASVASGASTGEFEALELRDGDGKRYGGLGVLKAVANVEGPLRTALIGKDAKNQAEIDEIMLELDGTENKSKFGANAILGISLAVCKAAAAHEKKPLYEYISQISGLGGKKLKNPIPMFNVLNGGQHADSGLSVQEFKIVPNGIGKFSEQLRAGSEIFHKLKKILAAGGYSTSVGDEGGFSPKLESNTKALELINRAISESGYALGSEVNLGLDVAANSFYEEKQNHYVLKPEGVTLEKERLINLYKEWIDKYHIISIEDGLHEEDWEGWAQMSEKLAKKTFLKGLMGSGEKGLMLIGDDLLVTNVKRLKKAIEHGSCNSVLIKVNQIGSLSETFDCMKLAKKNKMRTVISHRSGETTDEFISDLAVGTGADYMKSGSLSRGERICKYNRLAKIEQELGK
ncbi:MAG: Enolase [Candidatus Moranbacteria bacterium GW2011_GWE2_47_10]|nr:MAG: Enolase [Candidatus Moranbacteria bacterium GW2011_GWE2_47_10]